MKAHKNSISTSIYVDEGDTLWLGMKTQWMLKIILKDTIATLDIIPHPKLYYRGSGHGNIWGGGIPEPEKISRPDPLPTSKYDTNTFNLIEIIDNQRTEYYIPVISGRPGESAPLMLKKHSGNIIVSTQDLITVLDKTGCQQYKMPAQVIVMRQDRKGSIWIYCRHKGLYCFEGGDFAKKPKTYFADMFVTDIYQDNEGAYWFSTLSNGVLYLPGLEIRNYNNGMTEQNVRCIASTGDRVAAGYDNGIIQLFDPATESSALLTNLDVDNVNDIKACENGDVWIAGVSGILKRNHTFETDLSYYSLSGKKVIVESDTSVLFSSTAELYRLSNGKKLAKAIPPYLHRIFSVFIDNRKRIWLGTMNGLVELSEGRTDTNWGEKHPVLKNRISGIIEPVKGELWLSSIGEGILVLNLKHNRVTKVTPADGLASHICNVLFHDSRGTVWAGTNKGLSKIIRLADERLDISNVSIQSGLASNEINSICEADGKIWVGTNEGVSVFDPGLIEPNKLPPPVYITDVTTHGLSLPQQDHYELEHEQNFISLKFVGLSYKNAGSVQYKLKMEGIDKGWIYTTQPNIQYTTVPPGNYTFSVYAMNNDGYWSTKPAMVSFTVHPPYWETAWFRTGAAVGIVSIITLVFMIRYRYFKRVEGEKNELYRKIVDTELRALRAQMNPHFIFNSLNSIQRFILDSDTQGAHKYLGKFSKLVRMTLNNSSKEMITLGEELQTLRLYIDLEALRFKDTFQYSIEVGEDIDADNLKTPALMIQPFVENAIWHGLMPLGRNGRLFIKLENTGDAMKCTIEDNGIGRKAANAASKLQTEHESMGIEVTKERLEAINAKYNMVSRLEITDLYNNDGSVRGTRVELFFPLVYSL